jgi:hypothetical protein
MSFAAELRDFASGFNTGLSMGKKIKGIMDEREHDAAVKKAQDEADQRAIGDGPDPVVRRASSESGRQDQPYSANDKETGYSSSGYGGDPYSGDDSDVANYLDDHDKELAPILRAAAHDGKNWGALTYKNDKSPGGTADLENMTLDQVYGLQDQMKKTGYASTAVGMFQTIKPTLQRAVEGLGLDPATTKFDRGTQAKVAAYLARTDGGWDDFKAGKITKEQAAQKLAGVWAVLPMNKTGRGMYDGVNGNNADASLWGDVDGALSGTSAPRKYAGSDELLPKRAATQTATKDEAIPTGGDGGDDTDTQTPRKKPVQVAQADPIPQAPDVTPPVTRATAAIPLTDEMHYAGR